MIYRDDLIRAKKAARKLTNEQIATKSGLHINTVREICNGKENIELPSLQKVANALGLSMSSLFDSKTTLQKVA